MKPELFNNDCVNILTVTQSKGNVIPMRYGDIKKRLIQSQKNAFKQLEAIHDEQNKLRPQYRRYLDLEAQVKFYESRIKRTAAALQDQDEYESVEESAKKGKDISRAVGVPVSYGDVPL